MNSQLGIDDVKSFIRRRQTLCLVAFSIVFTCSIILAAVLPPVYRSQATIRITGQQVSEDLIKSVNEISPEERLQNLTGTVMSNINLEKVIKEQNLYPELQQQGAMNQAIGIFKQAIGIDPSFTDVMNPRTGRSMPVTSAIVVSFEGKDPLQVKNVTQALSDLYVQEDVKKREERASATTQFLEGELDRIQKQIVDQETKINNFKVEHAGELPENTASNLQTIANLERDLNRIESRIRLSENQKINLNGQLATVSPLSPIKTNQGEFVRDPYDRLRGLQMELLQLQTHFSDKHPDVVRAKREIAELQKELGKNAGGVDSSQLLKSKQAELGRLEEQFGDKHPDVIRLRAEISRLSAEHAHNSSPMGSYGYQKPDNPAYINIMTQIEQIDAELKSQIESKAQISNELEKYKQLLNNAPAVETQFNEMMRAYANTKKNYDELMGKLMSAKVSQAIEQNDRGTKFTLTEPANLPNKPYKPNRMAIIVLGFIGALAAGFGLAAVKEAMDRSIKSEKELSDIVNVPVLAAIPLVRNNTKKKKNNQ